MDFIDNLKKLSKNWRLLVVVIWLLVGVAIIPYPDPIVSLIGIIIFFPFLVFLMFLFLLSLVSKKNIFEFPPWKVMLFLLISLPIMLLISIILIVLFLISVISYFIFTSWFILYGCFLMGRQVDNQVSKASRAKPFLRTIIFIGGLAGSLALLFLFIITPRLVDLSVITETPIVFPWYLNLVYIIVGGILIGLAIIVIVYNFKKIFNGWFGIFALLVTFYTLFLALKIYLGIVDTEPRAIGSIWAYIAVIVPDMFIIFYSLSTLMGSQAEMLSKRVKRFGLDTIIVWLILSKVAYEFIHYFPYDLLNEVPIPWIQWFARIDNDMVNLIKDIAVLGFFILLLLIIGIYEIRKYSKDKSKLEEGIKDEMQEIAHSETILKEIESDNKESEVNKQETDIIEINNTEFYRKEESDN